MRNPEYRFESEWRLAGTTAEAVFDALHDYEQWPRWWPGAVRMRELEPAGPDGTGGRGEYVWRSAIGYRLRFEGRSTEVERPRSLAGTVEGDLVGTGIWHVIELEGGDVIAAYDWHVSVRRTWLRALTPILRPVFERLHDRLMRDGGRGLAEHLGATLVRAS